MTSSKEERLRKVAETIMRLAFQETEQAIDMASAGKLWPWCRSMDAAEMIDTEYAEEIGRLRAGLEAAEKALQIIAWEGADSATSKQILAACRDTAREALALSTVVGETE